MPVDEEQLQHTMSGATVEIGFNLPESLIAFLPSDPFEQLDLARKITSIALATRLAKLEDEIDGLRDTVAGRDDLIADLRAHIQSLDSTLGELSGHLTRTQEEKETLLNENAKLSDTVEKLNRDLSKQVGASRNAQMQISKASKKDSWNPPSNPSSASESGYAISNDGDFSAVDGSKHGSSRFLDLPSLVGTPRLSPPASPRIPAGLTLRGLSRPISPRRRDISVAAARNMADDRSGNLSSMPAARHNSMASPLDAAAQTGRTKVDGKEFFRQVRCRLSYEQFSAFLANVKELNSHNQTRGEALRKADEIFSPDNKDLYTIFEGLISRNLH